MAQRIENVVGAPMSADLMLCGTMFGLRIIRHRLFESSGWLGGFAPMSCNHTDVYDPWHGAAGQRSARQFREAMDIDWMTDAGGGRRSGTLSQAIPPAYTEFIGKQLMASLERMK